MSKLLEELNKMDPRQIVFVGSVSGSAWFDVARAGQMRREDYIRALSKREKDKMLRAARRAEARLKKLLQNPPVWEELAEGDTMEHSVGQYCQTLEAHRNAIRRVRETVSDTRRKVRDFVPLWDREVLEVYPRISDEGVCVHLPGDEMGDYWLIEEKYPDGVPAYAGE